MSKLLRLVAVCIGLVLVCGGRQLTATETIFAGVPVYSVMSTVDTFLVLSPSGVNAFTPLTIPCPAAAGVKGCTIRVTVSAVISGNSPDAFMQVTTFPFMTVSPNPAIEMFVGGADLQAPYTMQWVIKSVPAGSAPQVTVTGVASGVVALFVRTMSIDVFYGLI